MTRRKAFLAAAALAAAVTTGATAADTPGVTVTEIKIGNTVPYSGPASSYSVLGKLESAFFGMVNEQGGVAGHKINFISLDDNYSPPKTVEQIRRLVEEEKVAFTAARHQAQHEPDQLPPHHGNATREVGWQELGAVRQRDPGRGFLTLLT